ncbi:MAG: calcium-binding protein, partial [Pseudomonadota bacterium]
MATVDATGLQGSFDILVASNVAFATGTFTPFTYTWTTPAPATNQITAIGFLGDFTGAPSGTVNGFTVRDTSFATLLDITGLINPLPDFIDASSVGTSAEKFWTTVLAGDTTILAPADNPTIRMAGDGITATAGNAPTVGGNDSFQGRSFTVSDTNGTYIGDYVVLANNSTLNGGNDTFTDVLGVIYGDTFFSLDDSLVGGNDTIITTDLGVTAQRQQAEIYGDADDSSGLGNVTGGVDTVTLTNLRSAAAIYLDMDDTAGALVGGNDILQIETNIFGRAFTTVGDIFGDADQVSLDQFSSAAAVRGGNDAVTLRNTSAQNIYADFNDAGNRNIVGGDDTIIVESTFQPNQALPGVMVTGSVTGIFLDVDTFSTGLNNTFTGGNDTVTLLNTRYNVIYGDANGTTGPDAVLRGGNDTINVTFNRPDASSGPFIFGDFASVSSANATFGNDVINLDTRGSLPTIGQILADAGTVSSSSSNSYTMTFGDDRINILGDTGNLIFGDVSGGGISFATPSAVVFGNDIINAGDGNDFIHGDVVAGATFTGVSSTSGGNDILDGGLGNDFIDGGFGTNTASFASNALGVIVLLDGIPGTGTSGNLINAIGQGSDTLRNIQNVTGSSAEDIIIGDANANVLSGGASNDRLVGQDGNDTLNGDGGDDTLSGAMGNDILSGGGGVDLVNGGFGTDVLNGNAGNDTINGGSDNDQLFGGADNDTLNGQGGQDFLQGGSGDDT